MSNLSKYVIFKPVPGGYVYRVPNAWVFGSGVHLLVDDGQKAAIINAMELGAFVSDHSRFLGNPFDPLRIGSSLGSSISLCTGLETCSLRSVSSFHSMERYLYPDVCSCLGFGPSLPDYRQPRSESQGPIYAAGASGRTLSHSTSNLEGLFHSDAFHSGEFPDFSSG